MFWMSIFLQVESCGIRFSESGWNENDWMENYLNYRKRFYKTYGSCIKLNSVEKPESGNCNSNQNTGNTPFISLLKAGYASKSTEIMMSDRWKVLRLILKNWTLRKTGSLKEGWNWTLRKTLKTGLYFQDKHISYGFKQYLSNWQSEIKVLIEKDRNRCLQTSKYCFDFFKEH